jgi:hypothetical protein
MRWLWCWRCKTEMPMLDDQEFAEIASLHRLGRQSVKEYRAKSGAPLERVPLTERFDAMLSRYEEMTGYKETNPNAVWHHRLSLYGPPCVHCGKPLRSPNAKLCGSCKARRPLRSSGFANYPPRTSVEVEIAVDFQPQLRKFHNGLFVEAKAWIGFVEVSDRLH